MQLNLGNGWVKRPHNDGPGDMYVNGDVGVAELPVTRRWMIKDWYKPRWLVDLPHFATPEEAMKWVDQNPRSITY